MRKKKSENSPFILKLFQVLKILFNSVYISLEKLLSLADECIAYGILYKNNIKVIHIAMIFNQNYFIPKSKANHLATKRNSMFLFETKAS